MVLRMDKIGTLQINTCVHFTGSHCTFLCKRQCDLKIYVVFQIVGFHQIGFCVGDSFEYVGLCGFFSLPRAKSRALIIKFFNFFPQILLKP